LDLRGSDNFTSNSRRCIWRK